MDQTQSPAHTAIILAVLAAMFVAMVVLMIIPYWKIFEKAGFHPALSLLMMVPLANILILYYLAFATWKVVPLQQAVYPPQPQAPPQT